MYAPMERVDMFVTWDHRRDREGRKDYRGGILWHEGEVRFKKDCTLQGDVPITLYCEQCSTDLTKNVGTTIIVTSTPGGGFKVLVLEGEAEIRFLNGQHITLPPA